MRRRYEKTVWLLNVLHLGTSGDNKALKRAVEKLDKEIL